MFISTFFGMLNVIQYSNIEIRAVQINIEAYSEH